MKDFDFELSSLKSDLLNFKSSNTKLQMSSSTSSADNKINGKTIAQKLRDSVKTGVAKLIAEKGVTPGLRSRSWIRFVALRRHVSFRVIIFINCAFV